ncbi:MAG: hypothetical protein A2663_03150 [Candidatus Buchananbacteria bacterium RIFCSPHIGHO2_01_FULL_46_12]|uniref:Uncharacterized protein n=1 Tax=Candidatus Buchananbacteria bacterium RIFCSPHIGHO2_01_FULL_46_12 TaxID=1797536 RepID=A0A1G1Y7B8_9BACT|nr:MAG: hypothetical protein A2663_03150 [Candidatus Buchananbacteria bacterium RIFCSPHIGHO2_01_FULL_46_12]
MVNEEARKPVEFTTPAQRFHGDEVRMHTIDIFRDQRGLKVNGHSAKIEFNRIQLRLTTDEGHLYIIFDEFQNGSNPPKPIEEMYRALK